MKTTFPAVVVLTAATAISTHADDRTEDLEQITVTASRSAVALDDTGSSVTVISREEITRRGARTLADLLRDVPGMAVNQQGGFGTLAQVRMRGAEANQVLVLIDGVEANDIAQGNEFNFAHFTTAGIERVEIVRGPQSALWGSDALAGVINIITRPETGAGSTRQASLESGSFGTASAGLDIREQFERGALTFGASRSTTDGTNIARTGDEEDGYQNTTAQIGGRYSFTDNLEVRGLFRHTDSRVDFDSIDFVTTGLPIDAPNVTDSTQQYAKLQLDARLSERVSQRMAVHATTTDNTNRTSSPVDDVTRSDRVSVQAQTDIDFDRQHLALVAEYERDGFEQRGQATAFGDPNKDLDVDRLSLAGEWRFDGDAVDVSASFRHEQNSEFDDANTWRLTSRVSLTDQTSAFASWGRSIKNPTFTERFGFFDTFTGNPDLEPEHSRAWELGLRYTAGDTVAASASYFRSRLVDEINGFVFDPASGGFTAANRDGESRREGAEFDLRWQATRVVALDANYTWIDASEPTTGGEIPEVRRPEHIASLRAHFALDRLDINVGANYNGSQFDNYFPPFPAAQQRVTLPAYTLVDANVRYALTDSIVIKARAENVLDETYEDVYGFRGAGFAAFAGVEISW